MLYRNKAIASVLLVFIVFCVSSTFVEAKTHRPRSRKLENYVRIDMACPPTAMGISAAL